MKISKKQLEETVKKMVRNQVALTEQATNAYFQQESVKQEVSALALEFLEKLTQKVGMDSDAISEQAMPTFKRIHEELKAAMKKAAFDLLNIKTVLDSSKGPE